MADFHAGAFRMKLSCFKTQLFFSLFVCCFLGGCQDLEKLFAKNEKADPPSMAVAINEKTLPTASAPNAVVPELPESCFFSATKIPENIEVYAVDGQAWIDQSAFAKAHPKAITSLKVTLDSTESSALILTAKQAALWEIKTTPRSRLWAVYVTGESTQVVEGVNKPTRLVEHYAELGDPCGFYWRPELQVHGLYDFSKKLFGRPYISLTKASNGMAEIKALETHVSGVSSEIGVSPKYPDTERELANKSSVKSEAVPVLSITEALRTGVLRPGSISDIERFKSRFRATNRKEPGRRFDDQTSSMPIYVITADFSFPDSSSLSGANSVVFILDKQAPYPFGDSGHSPVLDMNSGTCMGRICEMIMNRDD